MHFHFCTDATNKQISSNLIPVSEKDIEQVGVGRKHKASDDQIIRTAWALFESKGYEATTMADIAEASDISRRSLFNYFPNKEALLFPFFDEQMEAFRTHLIARPQEETLMEAFVACITQLNPIMIQCELEFPAGPEVERARHTAAATRYAQEVWAAEMEDVALVRLGNIPDALVQAGFVGALTGQVLTEIAHLQMQNPAITRDQALQRTLISLGKLFS